MQRKGTFNYTDNSIGKISNNTFGGQIGNITAGIGNSVMVNENGTVNGSMQQISDAEWMELVHFFCDKQCSSDGADQEFFGQYEQAEKLAKKKDKKGLKEFIQSAGGAFMRIVLGAGIQAGVKKILDKILI